MMIFLCRKFVYYRNDEYRRQITSGTGLRGKEKITFKKVKAELPDPKPPKQKEDVKDKGCYEIENGHFFAKMYLRRSRRM